MAKQAKVWTGSAWADLASATTDLTPYSTTAQMNTAIAVAQNLVLVGTASPSAATTIQINNCFSSTYDRYLLLWSGNLASGAQDLRMQLTISGTPNTETLYFYGFTYVTNTAGPSRAYAGSQSFTIIGSVADISASGSLIINNPALAKPTNGNFSSTYWGSGANNIDAGGISHNKSVAYDGIKIYPGGSTITGEVRIYGYKNS
jgi:hypothetical protein